MKQLSQIEWAYIAGLFEGEGSVRFQNRGIQIEFSMTDREPLDQIAQMLDGNVRGPFKRQVETWTPIYRLCFASREVVEAFFSNTEIWLSPRKQGQFLLAFERRKAAMGY